MVAIARSALVGYSVQQMFALINDIEAYPQFMSGCIGAKILEEGDGFVEAQLTLGKSGIQQHLVSRNELHPPEFMIMRLIDGPFSSFEGRWQFQPLSETACKVSLDLEFEFSNPILAMTVSQWFEQMAGEQVDALCQRASALYK
ncbi:ubiquinone-binding protein [Candidatus Endobugula sertula]|uniref:Ubiquinone-binding protein n=1 Tax=Candidatus Endobugula sertula TaxID=62101 RepID=A0A1D2QS56_9GAMM|nr:ubiquinone-binding protein [Candidatus Endobugula sertula]